MSTVKISQLPSIPNGLNANTSNSLFLGVDIPTGITGIFTATQLAARLYANNVLNVGDNQIVLPNVVAQFSGMSESYVQINLQNDGGANGSADYVATADVGTDTTHYIDTGINNSNYNYNGTQPYRALDGYMLVAGSDVSTNPGGNLMIGSVTQGKIIDVVIGGVEDANVVASFIDNVGFKLRKKPIIFADNTSQNTAAKPAAFSQASYDLANTNSSTITIVQGVDVTQNTNIAAAINSAQAAYNKANNALANTSGTFGGDLTITGNVVVKGISTIANALFPATNAAVEIVGSSSGAQHIPANDGYMLHITGKDTAPTRVIVDSFGANNYSLYSGRSARGTAASPLATANNDVIARYSSSSYDGTSFPLLGVGRTDYVATENHTPTNKGTEMQIWTINNGSNTLSKTATFSGTVATFPNDIHANNVVLSGSLSANTLAGQVFFANISIGSSTANTVQFYPLYTAPAQMSGQIWYSGNSISLITDTDIAGDRPQVGKVLYERVYNSTGTTIAASSWVRLSGQTTANAVPYIALADATNAANSIVSGFVKNSIANGAYGFIYTRGIVDMLNMSSFNNGDLIFLSATPGQASNVAPVSSSLATIQVAKVLSNSATLGKIQVEITPRPEYGKANGAVTFANNNISVTSNNVIINESAGTLNALNGVIKSQKSFPGAQTAVTINFTTDTLVRANCSAPVTITPQNFVAGKEVLVVLTNTATGVGSNKVITHGVSALNSSVGATTFTLSGTTTALLRYVSFDGDLANTYVFVTYS